MFSMVLFEKGSPDSALTSENLREGVGSALDAIGPAGNQLVIPPDITRLPSRAGELTRYVYAHRPDAVAAILPALGTHLPMEEHELATMFGDLPRELFIDHHWRSDCVQAGVLSSEFMESVSDGSVSYDLPVFFNKALFDRRYDRIVSISQVVPHEVAGMAGYTKNIVVGCGGAENIHKTHFLGAAYGMERIMGRADSPVRQVLNHAVRSYLANLQIIHVITVLGMDDDGELRVRGLFIGDDDECYRKAVALSQKVNIHLLDRPLDKVVVYLDPVEYRSTWLGNKSIYRTRMAIADGGELLILAPGVKMFGEDPEIDRLIRRYGYRGTQATMDAVDRNRELQDNLSAAAHLIHGSSEDRFSITYCTGELEQKEVERAGFSFENVNEMMKRYRPGALTDGHNRLDDGEEVYYISAPGAGLWASREKFGQI